MKTSFGRKIFTVSNTMLMALLIIATLYPLLHVLFASFSRPDRIMEHTGLLLKPLDFSVAAYKAVAKNPNIVSGYANTLFIVFIGVAINIFMTSLGAYVLSRDNVPGSGFIMMAIVFTMYFSGGLIPGYLNVKDLGLLNTRWALIIPGAISTYNMIILRTAFKAIPKSLEESARMDGASHFQVLFKIILPLSMASIAVIGLYYAVAHWNSWFSASIYLQDRKLFPLQLILREILIINDTSSMTASVDLGDQGLISVTIKYAVIMVATVPILLLYPFLQRFFVKGVMIGSVKG